MIFCKNGAKIIAIYPPVAQLDNAADSDSEERGFESLRAGQNENPVDASRRDFRFVLFTIHFSLFIKTVFLFYILCNSKLTPYIAKRCSG